MTNPIELDDVATRVIAEGRYAFEPSELVRARVRRAVELRLVEGTSAPAWRGRQGMPGWIKVFAGAATASVATAALAYAVWRPAAFRNDTVKSARGTAQVRSVEAPLSPPKGEASAQTAQPEPAASPAVTRVAQHSVSVTPPSPVRKSETLADEVKLLGRVHAAIQSHDGVQALRLLQNYDQQFIRPQLREERAAAGVLALCAAGNVEAARRAAKRFQSNWPRSPLMGRVIDSCVASQ